MAANCRNKIFVYGTLKRGLRNHHLLKDAPKHSVVFVGEAKLIEKHGLGVSENKRIPFLLPLVPPLSIQDHKSITDRYQEIVGELYYVDDAVLLSLDKLERHPTFYTRTPTQCVMTNTSLEGEAPNDSVIDCEVYYRTDPPTEMYTQPFLSCYHDPV